jgi:hypothetical protein
MELAKRQLCIVLRNGMQIWIDEDRAEKLQLALNVSESKFINYGERIINSADVVGLFTPQDLDEFTRRKNGQWKCDYSNWHKREEICDCGSKEKLYQPPEIKPSTEKSEKIKQEIKKLINKKSMK